MADALDRILAMMREERPNLKLVCKADAPLMRATAALVYPLTPGFADQLVTVLGDVIYLPRPQEQMSRTGLAAILAHEFVHQLDMATYGPLFYTSYALAMPMGRTCRAWWERRAYAVDLMLAREEGGREGVERALDWIVPLFSGPSYGFMWAGQSAARRYLDVVARPVLAGTLQREQPYRRILSAWTGRAPQVRSRNASISAIEEIYLSWCCIGEAILHGSAADRLHGNEENKVDGCGEGG